MEAKRLPKTVEEKRVEQNYLPSLLKLTNCTSEYLSESKAHAAIWLQRYVRLYDALYSKEPDISELLTYDPDPYEED